MKIDFIANLLACEQATSFKLREKQMKIQFIDNRDFT